MGGCLRKQARILIWQCGFKGITNLHSSPPSAASARLEPDLAVASSAAAVAVPVPVSVAVAVSVALAAVVMSELVLVVGMGSAVVSEVVRDETFSPLLFGLYQRS